MPTLGEVLVFLIEKGPGRTEAQLAEAVYGNDGYQQQVNSECRFLLQQRRIERRGDGGPADPFRYHLPEVGR